MNKFDKNVFLPFLVLIASHDDEEEQKPAQPAESIGCAPKAAIIILWMVCFVLIATFFIMISGG
jgi:hypothetical protein